MQEIHPVIRVISFLVLTVFLALGAAVNLLIAAAVMALLLFILDRSAWKGAWPMLRRMRWLFLSIAVIYLWLTPGQPLVSDTTTFVKWLPNLDGVWQGGLRILSLVLMVVAASVLLQVTSRDQMLAALRWLLTPLAILGIPHERFAVRTALTLEAVAQVQGHIRDALATVPSTAKPVARIGTLAGVMLGIVTQKAEMASCATIKLPALRSPPLWQWGLPLLLTAVMTAARHWWVL